jgi:hypothetical protein
MAPLSRHPDAVIEDIRVTFRLLRPSVDVAEIQ